MLPSSTDLAYFVEVAAALNLSRAAERLGISQPSLSLAIQRLEQCIGTSLLVRSKRGVTLTPAGKQVLASARELLQRWDAVKVEALASTHEIQGTFTIGCHPSVALFALGKCLPDLLEANPRLDIRLYHDLSRLVVNSVIELKADLGVAVNPIRHPDLILRKLYTDEVTLWVGPGKRRVQDFRNGSAVLICDPNLLQTQDLIKKLSKRQVSFKQVLPSSSLEVVTELVASGAGIGIIPEKVVTRAAQNLRKIPGAPVFKDEICLVYRVENREVKALQVIAEAITRAFQ